MAGGGATTLGENGFGPPGSRRGAFSVGSTVALDDGVVVVVVVVVDVLVKKPIAAMAAISRNCGDSTKQRFLHCHAVHPMRVTCEIG